MSLLHYRRIERRRTARVPISINVLVYGEREAGEKFKYWTRTVSVSGYGGAMVLEEALEVGQKFELMNEYNNRKAQAKIVSVKNLRDGQAHAAFEFVEGGERFWSMVFPAAGAKPLRKLVPRIVNAE